MTDDELEQAMREGLAAKAEEATPTPFTAPERGGRGWMLAAAAAVVLVVGLAVALPRPDDPTDPPAVADPSPTGPVETTTPESVPDGWRREYFRTVQVDVPADWGWGGAPFVDGIAGGVITCGDAAFVTPDGRRDVNPVEDVPGYVGRPVPMTDVCISASAGGPERIPPTPYAWLGAAVEPGVVTFSDGFVQETILVGDETVTVGARDENLREQVLASARRNPGDVCSPAQEQLPPTDDGPLEPSAARGLAVCAYDSGLDPESPRFELIYATEVDAGAARRLLRATSEAPEQFCTDSYPEQVVALRFETDDGWFDTVAITDDCTLLSTPGGTAVELTPDTVAPWAVDGIPAYVVGPFRAGPLAPYFRGILG